MELSDPMPPEDQAMDATDLDGLMEGAWGRRKVPWTVWMTARGCCISTFLRIIENGIPQRFASKDLFGHVLKSKSCFFPPKEV